MARLVSTLVSGAKDIPKNASWLAGKALPHDEHEHTNGTPVSTAAWRRAPRTRSVT